MTTSDIRKQVIVALQMGDKRWKHLEVIYDCVNQDQRTVRDAIADLMDEKEVSADLDPRDGQPVYALTSRL